MFDVPIAALIGLALAPGLRAWFLGRTLGIDPNDPALAERYATYSSAAWSWVGIVTLLLALPRGPAAPLWILTLVGTAVGGFPARRRVLQESWGLGRYLDHALRFNIAPLTFWLLAVVLPAVAASTGGRWPIAVGVGGALYLFLYYRFTWFMVGSKRAAPLRDQALLASMTELAGRSRVPMPKVLVAPVVGGRWPNAVALPNDEDSHVIYGQTLIEALPTDEIVAIFAHEVAHLEHHAEPREKRKAKLLFWGIAAASLVVTVVAAKVEGFLGPAALVAWIFVWGKLFVGMMSGHQKHEAESDRRAAELLGDPEPLVRALVRLHVLGRQPARSALDVEAAATHPSLRGRIQALRALAGAAAPAAPPPALVLRSPAPGRWAIVGNEDVVLLDGVPAQGTELGEPEPAALRALAREARVFPYGELADLRVVAEGVATPSLLFITKKRERLEVPVADHDVAALQARLDVAPHTPDHAAAPRSRDLLLGFELAAMVVFGMTMAGSYNVLAGLLLALTARGSMGPLAMAAGVASYVAFGLVHTLVWRLDAVIPVVILDVVLLAAAWGFWRVSRKRALGEAPASQGAFAFQLLAVLGCVVWSAVQLAGDPGLAGLRAGAYRVPDAGVPLVVLAAVLWKHRRAWVLAGLCLALAWLPFVAGTPWAAQTFGLDALVGARPVLRATREPLIPIGSRRLGRSLTRLVLSPAGTSFSTYDSDVGDEPDECRSTHIVGGLEGPLREIEACDGVPLDDGGFLAVVDLAPPADDDAPRRLALRRLSRDGVAPVWERALDERGVQRLEVDAEGGVRLVGWTAHGTELVERRGRLDDPASLVEVRRFPTAAPRAPEWFEEQRDDTGATLRLTRRLQPQRPKLLERYRRTMMQTSLGWGAGASAAPLGRTALDVTCPQPPWHARGFFCAAHDRDQTFLWRVDDGRLAFVGRVAGRALYRPVDLGAKIALLEDSTVYLVDRASGRLTWFYPGDDDVTYVAAAGGRVGILTGAGPEGATIALYGYVGRMTP